MTTKPRDILWSPKIRLPRRERPQSIGKLNRIEAALRSHSTCAAPDRIKAATMKTAQAKGSAAALPELDVDASVILVSEEKFFATNPFRQSEPSPPMDFIHTVVRNSPKVVAGNEGVHMMKFMRIEIEKHKLRHPRRKT